MKQFLVAGFLLFAGLPAFAQQAATLPANDQPSAKNALGYSVRNNAVITGSAVTFKPGTAAIQPSSERALRTIVKYLNEKTYVSQLRIEAHTVCGKGDQALSEARAKAVADWLVAHGADCRRLVATGFGCTKPLTADHAELNERVDFVNAALRGHLIADMPADGGGKSVTVTCQ